jgi:hypothetical protein
MLSFTITNSVNYYSRGLKVSTSPRFGFGFWGRGTECYFMIMIMGLGW